MAATVIRTLTMISEKPADCKECCRGVGEAGGAQDGCIRRGYHSRVNDELTYGHRACRCKAESRRSSYLPRLRRFFFWLSINLRQLQPSRPATPSTARSQI